MSGPDGNKIDPFSIAFFGVMGAPEFISKQQLVDALVLVIDGKITQSWEHSYGMTREKTELIQAKKELSDLSFNGWENASEDFRTNYIQGIVMKLSVFKRRKAEEEARAKAEEAREKAKEAREKAEEARKAAENEQGGDLLGGGDGALPNPTDNDDNDAEEEYNDYSSSN